MKWTKREVKAALGLETDAELARMIEVKSRWAVGQWPDDQPIPQARQWQLSLLRPDVFGASGRRTRNPRKRPH